MSRRLAVPLLVASLLLVGAGPAPDDIGLPDLGVETPGVPDPYDVFPLGVCTRVPPVDPRPICVVVDPE